MNNMEAWRGRCPPKKRWLDCVRQDMRDMAVSDEMTSDREELREKKCADPKWIGKRGGERRRKDVAVNRLNYYFFVWECH
jgi:hypothetical protein